MMTEKAHDKNMEALHAGIARSQAEIAELAANLKKLARHAAGNGGNGDADIGGWLGFQHKLDEASARGKQVAQGVADEIIRHPLLSGAAAFGLGFVFARLLFRRGNA